MTGLLLSLALLQAAAAGPSPEPTATSSVSALPGQARGLVQGDEVQDDLRWVPRSILFIPRWAFTLVMAPIQGALYLLDRFELIERAEDLFFNDARTFGIIPTFFGESGFGLNAGVRIIHRDLFGKKENISVRAGFGGRLRQTYGAAIGTGQRFGRLNFQLSGGYDTLPRLRFFGIGNDGKRPLNESPQTERIDPYIENDVSVETELAERRGWVRLQAGFQLSKALHLQASTRYRHSNFDDPVARTSAQNVYVLDRWLERGEAVKTLHSELQLTFDTRRPSNPFVFGSTPSTGWLAAVFGGPTSVLSDDGTTYFHWGLDVQRFFDLYQGNRVLVLRAHVASVTGNLRDVPIVDLPTLGGPNFLRGFIRYRFRDRAQAMASAEYRYPFFHYGLGYFFVDAGRVFRTLEDFTLNDMHVGFGGGIQLHTPAAAVFRIQLAATVREGMMFSLIFAPDLSARPQEDP